MRDFFVVKEVSQKFRKIKKNQRFFHNFSVKKYRKKFAKSTNDFFRIFFCGPKSGTQIPRNRKNKSTTFSRFLRFKNYHINVVKSKKLFRTYKARFTNESGNSATFLFGLQENGLDFFSAFGCDPLIQLFSGQI